MPTPPFFAPTPMNIEGDIPFQQASLEYTWEQWTFQAEYFTFRYEDTTSVAGTDVSEATTNPDAWYVGVSRRITPWLEAGTYYGEYYADTSTRDDSGGYQKDAALALRFDPTDWWILKIEGHYLQGTALLHDDANNPVRDGRGWWMLALKTTVSF